jgi:hypothetical protein
MVARNSRQPGMRRWMAKATISGRTSWIGTESAKMPLFFSALRKIGSLQSRRKLCSPTHCDGVMPSQRVNAWYRMLPNGYATKRATSATAGAA